MQAIVERILGSTFRKEQQLAEIPEVQFNNFKVDCITLHSTLLRPVQKSTSRIQVLVRNIYEQLATEQSKHRFGFISFFLDSSQVLAIMEDAIRRCSWLLPMALDFATAIVQFRTSHEQLITENDDFVRLLGQIFKISHCSYKRTDPVRRELCLSSLKNTPGRLLSECCSNNWQSLVDVLVLALNSGDRDEQLRAREGIFNLVRSWTQFNIDQGSAVNELGTMVSLSLSASFFSLPISLRESEVENVAFTIPLGDFLKYLRWVDALANCVGASFLNILSPNVDSYFYRGINENAALHKSSKKRIFSILNYVGWILRVLKNPRLAFPLVSFLFDEELVGAGQGAESLRNSSASLNPPLGTRLFSVMCSSLKPTKEQTLIVAALKILKNSLESHWKETVEFLFPPLENARVPAGTWPSAEPLPDSDRKNCLVRTLRKNLRTSQLVQRRAAGTYSRIIFRLLGLLENFPHNSDLVNIALTEALLELLSVPVASIRNSLLYDSANGKSSIHAIVSALGAGQLNEEQQKLLGCFVLEMQEQERFYEL